MKPETEQTINSYLTAGKHPLIHPDVVSAPALILALWKETDVPDVSRRSLSVYLRKTGFRRCYTDKAYDLWARIDIPEHRAIALAKQRLANGHVSRNPADY